MHRHIQRVEIRADFGGAKGLPRFILLTVSEVEDNFQGENGEKFSQQNGPSYT